MYQYFTWLCLLANWHTAHHDIGWCSYQIDVLIYPRSLSNLSSINSCSTATVDYYQMLLQSSHCSPCISNSLLIATACISSPVDATCIAGWWVHGYKNEYRDIRRLLRPRIGFETLRVYNKTNQYSLNILGQCIYQLIDTEDETSNDSYVHLNCIKYWSIRLSAIPWPSVPWIVCARSWPL